MTLAKVLAEHWQCVNDHHNAAANRPHCFACKEPWPCDAVEMARQLQEAQERVAWLETALQLGLGPPPAQPAGGPK